MSSQPDLTSLLSQQQFNTYQLPSVQGYIQTVSGLNYKSTESLGLSSLNLTGLEDFMYKLYDGNYTSATSSYSDFITAYESYLENVVGTTTSAAQQAGSDLQQAFLSQFEAQWGIDPSQISTNLGDLEALYQAVGGSQTRQDFLNTMLTNSFNYFITHYEFPIPSGAEATNGGPNPTPDASNPNYWTDQFATAYEDFFSQRVTLTNSSGNLTSYEKIFNEFVGPNPSQSFQQVLATFYNDAMQRDGVFNPSLDLPDWIRTVETQQSYESGQATSVAGTNSDKAEILLVIFSLLVEMINVLQRVAAAQGERLTFYAGYQKAYTNLIAKIPIISEQNIQSGMQNDNNQNTIATTLSATQSYNQSYTQRLQAYRSAIGDEAKQQQTTVNQSNQIVTQEANLGTSIIQEMSQILTSMFK